MDQPWWGPAVQWTVWGILMALAMGWVARSRFKTRPDSDSQRLVHPPSTLIIGIVVFLFFAGIAIVSNVFPNRTVTWWTTAVFAGFALLSLAMVAAYFLGHRGGAELRQAGWSPGISQVGRSLSSKIRPGDEVVSVG